MTSGLLLPSQLFPSLTKPLLASESGPGPLGRSILDSNSDGDQLVANNRNPFKFTRKRGLTQKLLGELTKSEGKLRVSRNHGSLVASASGAQGPLSLLGGHYPSPIIPTRPLIHQY